MVNSEKQRQDPSLLHVQGQESLLCILYFVYKSSCNDAKADLNPRRKALEPAK